MKPIIVLPLKDYNKLMTQVEKANKIAESVCGAAVTELCGAIIEASQCPATDREEILGMANKYADKILEHLGLQRPFLI